LVAGSAPDMNYGFRPLSDALGDEKYEISDEK